MVTAHGSSHKWYGCGDPETVTRAFVFDEGGLMKMKRTVNVSGFAATAVKSNEKHDAPVSVSLYSHHPGLKHDTLLETLFDQATKGEHANVKVKALLNLHGIVSTESA